MSDEWQLPSVVQRARDGPYAQSIKKQQRLIGKKRQRHASASATAVRVDDASSNQRPQPQFDPRFLDHYVGFLTVQEHLKHWKQSDDSVSLLSLPQDQSLGSFSASVYSQTADGSIFQEDSLWSDAQSITTATRSLELDAQSQQTSVRIQKESVDVRRVHRSYSHFLAGIGQDELVQAFEQDHASFETKMAWFASTLHTIFKALHACYFQAVAQTADYGDFFEYGKLPGVTTLPTFTRQFFERRYSTGSARNCMLLRFLIGLEFAAESKTGYAVIFSNFLTEKWDNLCLVLLLHAQPEIEQLIRKNVVLDQHFCGPDFEAVSYDDLHEMLPFLMFHRSVLSSLLQTVLQCGTRKQFEHLLIRSWDEPQEANDESLEWVPMFAVLTVICNTYHQIPARTKVEVNPARKAMSAMLAQLQHTTSKRQKCARITERLAQLESSLAEVRSQQLQIKKDMKSIARDVAVIIEPDALIEQSGRMQIQHLALQLEETRLASDLARTKAELEIAMQQQEETWNNFTSSQAQVMPEQVTTEGSSFGLVKVTFKNGLTHVVTPETTAPENLPEYSDLASLDSASLVSQDSVFEWEASRAYLEEMGTYYASKLAQEAAAADGPQPGDVDSVSSDPSVAAKHQRSMTPPVALVDDVLPIAPEVYSFAPLEAVETTTPGRSFQTVGDELSSPSAVDTLAAALPLNVEQSVAVDDLQQKAEELPVEMPAAADIILLKTVLDEEKAPTNRIIVSSRDKARHDEMLQRASKIADLKFEQHKLALLGKIFKAFRQEMRVKRFQQYSLERLKRIQFRVWRANCKILRRAQYAAAVIQRSYRVYRSHTLHPQRRRAWRLIVVWRKHHIQAGWSKFERLFRIHRTLAQLERTQFSKMKQAVLLAWHLWTRRSHPHQVTAVGKLQGWWRAIASDRHQAAGQKLGFTLLKAWQQHTSRRQLRADRVDADLLQAGSDWFAHARCQEYFSRWLKYRTVHQRFRAALVRRWFTTWTDRQRASNQAVVKLQSAWRGYEVRSNRLDARTIRRSITRLQARVRSRRVQRWYLQVRQSSVVIQTFWRGIIARWAVYWAVIEDMMSAADANDSSKLRHYFKHKPHLAFSVDQAGNTALHRAAWAGSRHALKLCVEFGLPLDAQNNAGWTGLHLCVMSLVPNRVDFVQYLVKQGADVNVVTNEWKTATLLACECGETEVLASLLQLGAQVGFDGDISLHFAVRSGVYQNVELLLEHGVNIGQLDETMKTALHVAAAESNAEITALLIHMGAELDAMDNLGWTALMHACYNTNMGVVELLLAEHVDWSLLNQDGQNALHVAAMTGSIELTQLLLETGLPMDGQDSNGQTPLQIAAAYNHDQLGIFLLGSGAISNIQDLWGDQCAHTAALANCIELMTVLIDYDEHIGRKNFSGMTALGICRLHGHLEIEHVLLEYFHRSTNASDHELLTDSNSVVEHVDDAMLVKWTEDLELPMTRTAQPLALRLNIDSSTYQDEAQLVRGEIDEIRKLQRLAIVMQARVRRKLAWNKMQRRKKEKHVLGVLARFAVRWKLYYRARRAVQRTEAAVRIQKVWRGHRCRMQHDIHSKVLEWRHTSAYMLLGARIARRWRNYRARQEARIERALIWAPANHAQWQQLIASSIWLRAFGVYDEYEYPLVQGVKFYVLRTSGRCTFKQPWAWRERDAQQYREMTELREFGVTRKDKQLITRVQAVWRGVRARRDYNYIRNAKHMFVGIEQKYLETPEDLTAMCYYALYMHAVVHDYATARQVYIQALQKMAWRGPDNATLLYSYAIFVFVTEDEHLSIVQHFTARAQAAEMHARRQRLNRTHSQEFAVGQDNRGKPDIRSPGAPAVPSPLQRPLYEFASIGIFHQAAIEQNTAEAWHNFAACRFIVFNDIDGAMSLFVQALSRQLSDPRLQRNFQLFMRECGGEHAAAMTADLERKIVEAAERETLAFSMEEVKRVERRRKYLAAVKLQNWSRDYVFKRKTRIFASPLLHRHGSDDTSPVSRS